MVNTAWGVSVCVLGSVGEWSLACSRSVSDSLPLLRLEYWSSQEKSFPNSFFGIVRTLTSLDQSRWVLLSGFWLPLPHWLTLSYERYHSSWFIKEAQSAQAASSPGLCDSVATVGAVFCCHVSLARLFVGVTWLWMPAAKENFPRLFDSVRSLTSMDILTVWGVYSNSLPVSFKLRYSHRMFS